MTDRQIYIAIPAFGPPYVKLAVKYTIPAVLSALHHASMQSRAVFLIHTDYHWRFEPGLKGYDARYFPVVREPDARPFPSFIQCHKHAISLTPAGALLALLNADIVVSRETFAVVDEILQHGKSVIASAGVRTVIAAEEPPIGASADALAEWIWRNKHPITQANIWGSGTSRLPTMLYFEDGENVAMHGFHLTPMFLVKDKDLSFVGSIDDAVLATYKEDEIVYLTDRQASFAEISPADKQQGTGPQVMNVEQVLNFGRKRFKPSHIENFRHRFAIMGRPQADHPAVEKIIKGLTKT